MSVDDRGDDEIAFSSAVRVRRGGLAAVHGEWQDRSKAPIGIPRLVESEQYLMRAFRLKALVSAVLTTRRFLPLLAAVLLMPVGGVGANDYPARVLVLLPVSAELPAMQEIVRSLRETIESRSERPVDVCVHAADFALFPSDRYQAVLADYLGDSYRSLSEEQQPDVIVAVWSPSYRFFKTYREVLFPDVPLIFVGMSRHEPA